MDDGVFAKEDYFAGCRDEEGIHRGYRQGLKQVDESLDVG